MESNTQVKADWKESINRDQMIDIDLEKIMSNTKLLIQKLCSKMLGIIQKYNEIWPRQNIVQSEIISGHLY